MSGDDSLVVSWSNVVNNDYVILQTQLQTQQPFTEVNNHAHDSTAYYSMKSQPGLTWQIGEDIVVRAQFANASSLQNTTDTTFRAVSDRWPVFGISVDVGTVGSTASTPVVWTLGVVRTQSVQYKGLSGLVEQRSAYYWSNFSSPTDVVRLLPLSVAVASADVMSKVNFFLNDFSRAVSAANAMDASIRSAGSQISGDYADLLTLSLRQVMSAVEITVTKGSDNQWNTSDVKSFMKNMGSVGSSGG